MTSRVVYKVFGYVSPLLTCRRRHMRSPPRTSSPGHSPSPPSLFLHIARLPTARTRKPLQKGCCSPQGGTRRRRKERETMEKLRRVDIKAEHFLRQVQRAEQERDQWEKKYEEMHAKYKGAQGELDELAKNMEGL
ncbi:hypothetical protein V8E55_005644 [Tylopilus felleus]